jgi:exodeoxyribonuclease VII small subunit
MSEPPVSYESATARIEEIIRRLDSGEAGLRETLTLVKEGRDLIDYCARELDAVSSGLEQLRLDELVARLEAGSAASAAPATGDAPRAADDAPPAADDIAEEVGGG